MREEEEERAGEAAMASTLSTELEIRLVEPREQSQDPRLKERTTRAWTKREEEQWSWR